MSGVVIGEWLEELRTKVSCSNHSTTAYHESGARPEAASRYHEAGAGGGFLGLKQKNLLLFFVRFWDFEKI
jgi:hypothetical protein